MKKIDLSVHVTFTDGTVNVIVGLDGSPLVMDSKFTVDSVMPKTVHAVVCSAVSDALAKEFNDILSSKEERK